MDWSKLLGLGNNDEQESQNTMGPPAAVPTDAAPAAQEQPETPQVPTVKDYISKKYNLAGPPVEAAPLSAQYNRLAGDDSAVNDAKASAADDKRRARIIEGLSTMFAGRKHTDSSFYNGLTADADAKVAAAQKDKQGKLSDFLTSDKLTGEQLARGDQQRLRDHAANEDKVDSDESNLAQAIAKRMDPKGTYDGLSATQIKAQVPLIKDIFDQEMKQQDVAIKRTGLANDRADKQSEKVTDRDIAFGKTYHAAKGKFIDAISKIDNTLSMVDQAVKGGVASQLVPLEVARQIAGRLNPQEIAAASGDPSTVGKLQRYFDKASTGQMTVQDAREYRELLAGQKDHLNTAWQNKSQGMQYTYAKATKRDKDAIRSLVEDDDQTAPSNTPAASAAAPAAKRKVSKQEVADYAAKHDGMDPTAAAAWLKSQGYEVEN